LEPETGNAGEGMILLISLYHSVFVILLPVKTVRSFVELLNSFDRGALTMQAEIKPLIPDAGNADVGK
jgi:hypothetical protein